MNEDTFVTLGEWENPGDFRAAIILLHDKHGRVSIQFRDDFMGVSAGGQWGYFGGEIEAGETTRQAAQRELAEETGIDMPFDAFIPFVKTLSNSCANGQHYVYRCATPVDIADIRLKEGAGFAFVNANQLDKFDLIPVTKRVLLHYFSQIS